MYKDWQYFLERANEIINSFGVKYVKSNSGYDKGKYSARLAFPSYVDNSENVNLSRRQYLIDKVGFEIQTFSRISDQDKEAAKGYLQTTIARELSKFSKMNNIQKISDKWNYFLENKTNTSLLFYSEIGEENLDYFNILSGTINESNWKNKNNFRGELKYDIQNAATFKELYFLAKQFAKKYHLKNNDELTRELRNQSSANKSKIVNTFVFDEENIPEIKVLENKISGEVLAPITTSNNLDLILNESLQGINNKGFVKVGYRKAQFLKTPIFVGRERNVVFSNDTQSTGYFAVVELDEILASHNESTFGNTIGYPTDETGRNVNDRNYTGDKNAQAKVISVGQKLNPNIIISTSATASGTPIISVDGIVVSGNNRTMSLKIAANQYPEIYEKYKKILYSELESGGYGIQMSNVFPAIKKPVLVRFDLGFNEYTTSELNKYNKVRSKSEKPIDIAIRLSRQLSDNPNCQNQLITLVSEQEIVSDLYNDKNAITRLRKILLDCNIITENEISNLFSGNSLTNFGKILYETLLLSMVLKTDAIEISQNDGIKSTTKSIVNAIIPLIKNKNIEGFSLIDEINNALLIQNQIVSRNFSDLMDYVTQGELFETNEIINKKSVVLNWFMNQSVNLLKTTLAAYNNSAESNVGENIFGDNLTESEVFSQIFEQKVDPKLLSLFEKNNQPEKLVSLSNEKAELNERIKNLEIAKKYQSEGETKEIDELLNRLKIALKYL